MKIIRKILPAALLAALACGALGTLARGALAAPVQQRMAVAATVVAPCAIDRLTVTCSGADHFTIRTLRRPLPARSGAGGYAAAPAGQDGEWNVSEIVF